MKLSYRVFSRLSVGIVAVLSIWAVCFYFAIMDEVTDEVDDSLEDYSEMIIRRSLAGETLPSNDSGSNNQYFIKEVAPQWAMGRPAVEYKDSMVYIVAKNETEPARIYTTIFMDNEGRYFQLEVSVPTIEKADLRESIVYLIVGLYVVLLLAFLLINYFVFRRSMKPFYAILDWLDATRPGSGSGGPAVDTDTTEFRKLGEALARYSNHSEELFKQQKQFIGDASHEVQTPVAICINRIEMLMEDESVTQKQMEELQKVHKTLGYVSRLNKSLLLLTKIDNNQFCDVEDVDMNAILRNVAEDYTEVYAYKEVSLALEENGVFDVRINRTLAGILAANLVKNAFVHNVQGGRVQIRCSSDKIEFFNTASGEALDSACVFERFWQGSRKEGSAGLGLAIAQAICRHFNLSLEYSYNNGMHCFTISRQIS